MDRHLVTARSVAGAAALQALITERGYQEALHAPNTASNPAVPLDKRLHWVTEEYLEAVTAYNDGMPIFEVMMEINQIAALCTAIVEGYVSSVDPLFHLKVRKQRDQDLAEKRPGRIVDVRA